MHGNCGSLANGSLILTGKYSQCLSLLDFFLEQRDNKK